MTTTIRGHMAAVMLVGSVGVWLHAAGQSPINPQASTARATAQFERRVAEKPQDYLSASILGQLYGRHARETGDFDAYTRAETAFRQALAANKDHLPALLGLASTLGAEHRFTEAIALARRAQAANPGSPDALIVLGDASAEIGKYDEADAAFKELQIRLPNAPFVLARVAHLAELKGKHTYALALLRQAAAAEFDEEGKGEASAWYETRIASLLFRTGQLGEAAVSFTRALQLFDGYYIALDGLADVRAAQGRGDEAIGLLETVVARVPQPGSFIALGDLYAARGRTTDAERVYARAESIAGRPGSYQSAYRRELAMFYANHDRNVPQALVLAQRDLDARPDLYGFDAFAWALYKNGRFDEAAEAMSRAMALGTEDAGFYTHAGLIAHRRGQNAEALNYLERAHDICPCALDASARAVRTALIARRP
jgi:tetratricopeptide (TPR) repeat protein